MRTKSIATILLALLYLPATAALTITSGDIQQDGGGFYYPYELTFANMQNTSMKFENDVLTAKSVAVHKTPYVLPPSNPQPRWVYPDAGQKYANFVYKFDVSGIVVNVGGDLFMLAIESADVTDKLVMANNPWLNEQTQVIVEYGVNGSNYTTWYTATTPGGSFAKVTTHDATLPITGDYEQTFYLRVRFVNTDGDGFDADLTRWSYLEYDDTDHFTVRLNLSLRGSPPGTYDGGDGTSSAPYRIATPQQLHNMSHYPMDWDKHFIVVNDLDMTGFGPYERAPISPDPVEAGGYEGIPFTGAFDGQDHRITSFRIDTQDASNDYLGLFGQIAAPAVISNLHIEARIYGDAFSRFCGLLVGSNDGGAIHHCSSEGALYITHWTGGLVGINNGSLSYCSSSAVIHGSSYLGGLVGSVTTGSPAIHHCWADSTVIGAQELGGLIGTCRTDLDSCFSKGEVIGENGVFRAGGLIGYVIGNTISNCYTETDVIADGFASNVGGFVGDDVSTAGAPVSFEHCYAAGRVITRSDTSNFGAFVGDTDGNLSFTGCLFDPTATGQTDGVGALVTNPIGLDGVTSDLMRQTTTYTTRGYDLTNTWALREDQTRAHLQFENYCLSPLDADTTGDCRVDLRDLAQAAQQWLNCTALNPGVCE